MNTEESMFLAKLNTVFKKRNRPSIISSHKDYSSDDFECNSIQDQFGKLELNEMTKDDAVMMIIDSSLICEEAILFFLPKLAEIVLIETEQAFMFQLQLKTINKSNLTREENEIILELENRVGNIIKETEINELNEIKK